MASLLARCAIGILTASAGLVAADDLQPPLGLSRALGQTLQTRPKGLRRHRAPEALGSLGLPGQRSSRLLTFLLLAHHAHSLQTLLQQPEEALHGRHVSQEARAALEQAAHIQVGVLTSRARLLLLLLLLCGVLLNFVSFRTHLCEVTWIYVFADLLEKVGGGQEEEGEDVLQELQAEHGRDGLQVQLTLGQIGLKEHMVICKTRHRDGEVDTPLKLKLNLPV